MLATAGVLDAAVYGPGASGAIPSHDGKVVLEEVIAARASNIDATKPRAKASPAVARNGATNGRCNAEGDLGRRGAIVSLADVQRRKEAAIATMRELEFLEKSGRLISIDVRRGGAVRAGAGRGTAAGGRLSTHAEQNGLPGNRREALPLRRGDRKWTDAVGATPAPGSINATHIVVGSLTGGLMATTGIITAAAQIDDSVITNAKITNLSIDKLLGGEIGAQVIYVDPDAPSGFSEVLPRPALTGFDKTVIAADGRDEATITACPIRAR